MVFFEQSLPLLMFLDVYQDQPATEGIFNYSTGPNRILTSVF